MEEEWRDIKGYEGLYQVSNLGRVRSLDRYVQTKKGNKSFHKGKILIGTDTGHGYMKVSLLYNGRRKSVFVHRLVAEAFIPNPKNKPEVNHINCIKNDNRVVNLEWVTSSENKIHYNNTENGVIKNKKIANTRFYNKIKNKEQKILDMYCLEGNTIENIAKDVKLCPSTIRKVLINHNVTIQGSQAENRKVRNKLICCIKDGKVVKEFSSYNDIYHYLLNSQKIVGNYISVRKSIHDVIIGRRGRKNAYGMLWREVNIKNE